MLQVFKNKKVLITGNTGFKGSWLTIWLIKLGAQVIGFSDGIPTNPSLFLDANLESKIKHTFGDVRDIEALEKIIFENKPDFIFHLAAQAIVSTSYTNPVKTMETNFMGTVNMLDCLRRYGSNCVVVMITSDKCYENVEWIWGYKETDQLGGRDVYSASKGAAEIAFHSYMKSFFEKEITEGGDIRLATGRAGNVIGGGDWAKDRIIVDCIKCWINDLPVEIRSPSSTRPWQHVLEPLSGYLTLAATMAINKSIVGESFNFGPLPEKSRTVLDLINDLFVGMQKLKKISPYCVVKDEIPFHEAGLLRLNCEKALFKLKWESTLSYSDCISFVANWYDEYIQDSSKAYEITLTQIENYEIKAKEKKAIWTSLI